MYQAFNLLLSKSIKLTFGVNTTDDIDLIVGSCYKKILIQYPYCTIEDVSNAFLITDAVKKDFQSLTVGQVMAVIDSYFKLKNSVKQLCIDLAARKHEEVARVESEKNYFKEVEKLFTDSINQKKWLLSIPQTQTIFKIMADSDKETFRMFYRLNKDKVQEEVQNAIKSDNSTLGIGVSSFPVELLQKYFSAKLYFEKL